MRSTSSSSASSGHASHFAVKTGDRGAFSARRACISGGNCSASGRWSRSYGFSRRSMNLRLPVLSDGSDHGTTSTGSSAEHSTDHSESITNYLSVPGDEAVKKGNLGVGQKKTQQRMFGPVAVVA